jgi:hypothetical protein
MYKQLFLLVILGLLVLSCGDKNIVLETKKEAGAITGQVYPTDAHATVELYLGVLLKTTTADDKGYFYFDDLKIGYYRIKAYAKNFGYYEVSRIHVEEGAVNDIGTIGLSQSSNIFHGIYPPNNRKHVLLDEIIRLTFKEPMNTESVLSALSITPMVDYQVDYETDASYFYIRGSFNFETEYTVKLDTSAQTLTGRHLEYIFTSAFTTDRFRAVYALTNGNNNLLVNNLSIYVQFSGLLYRDSVEHFISISPSNDFQVFCYDDGITLYPKISWKSNTLYNVAILKGIQSVNGTITQTDTSFIFRSDVFKVTNTTPYQGQNFISKSNSISIAFNYALDESTIANALKMSPEFVHKITTSRSNSGSTITISPESLLPETKYEITISDDLKDYYGNKLSSPYTFNFTTASY